MQLLPLYMTSVVPPPGGVLFDHLNVVKYGKKENQSVPKTSEHDHVETLHVDHNAERA